MFMTDETAADRNSADVAFIRALAELLNQNELTEIAVKREYAENDVLNVRVSRQVTQVAAAPLQVAVPAPAHAPQFAANAQAAAASADPADLPGAVTSPMVGTAYLSPEPGATPFVTVGQQVSAGQTLLIIEAMKTMNQIPAPHGGTVRRILVGDGSPVEYGAPLMIID
jgi:acetyl-CoA carboxylase biotin carboxyl carrier protein